MHTNISFKDTHQMAKYYQCASNALVQSFSLDSPRLAHYKKVCDAMRLPYLPEFMNNPLEAIKKD